MKKGMRGAHVVVDGEELTVEDTVMAAVCDGRLSPDLLDHGFDTYWCVTEDGHHRLLRASELVATADQPSSRAQSSFASTTDARSASRSRTSSRIS